jgi:hypothetical protein
VWFVDKPVRNDLHPTMKPVALVERAVRNSSKSRDIVLDPFGGSGSTLIACEKIGRQARLMELDPKYVDTIILRWQGGVALRKVDEPAAAGGDERVDHVDQNAVTETAQRRSCACGHIHLAPGSDPQDAPVRRARLDEQRCQPACGSGADHVVL